MPLSSSILTPGRMTSLIPASTGRPADDPIFALNAEAQRRAALGEKVINASLGALMQDDGQLAVMPAVHAAMRAVDPTRASAYAPIAGDTPFLEAVVRDVFEGTPFVDQSVCVATAGGTGAVHHAVVNFLEEGQALYTSDYFWGPYKIIANHTRRAVETFPMFDGAGRFNVQAFESGLEALLQRQGRALVILNFPCHNPTGYSLDEAEWRAVAAALERVGAKAPVTLLVDFAYARYGKPGSTRWPEWIGNLPASVTLLVAWSASKSFAQYGSRVGALIAVTPDEELRRQVGNALSYSCRGTWSNCNHLGLLAIANLLQDPEQRAAADADRAKLKALIDQRVERFNACAERLGLRTPRYEGGFFVAVFSADAAETQRRAQEQGVFVVPLSGAVRVALCSTALDDVEPLAEVLARTVTE